MSFEIKYDRDGNPIPGQAPQIPVEEAAPQPSVEERLEAAPEEQPTESQPEQQPAAEVKEEPVSRSLSVLRKRAEEAEKRAYELEQALKSKQPERQEVPEEDLNFSVDEDALVEGKHLSKVDKKIKKLEQQIRQYEQQSVASITEARLKAQYPDFDSVVSSENLANLRAAYPEIAQTLNASTDLYSKAVSAYTMIKRLGIIDPEDRFIQEKAIAQKNATKPKPLASISPQQGDSPLSKANAFANGLDENMKKQLWKEMNDIRRNS